MRTTNLTLVGALLGLSFVVGCRSSSSSNSAGLDAPAGDAGDAGGIRIQDVQSDSMPVGTAVSLHGVVVTAIDAFGTKVGQDIWVEEPGGGERSGVHVFRPPVDQISSLAVGDIVDLTGAVKSEFATTSDKTGRTVTELQAPSGGAMTVTKTGTGTVPPPHVIDAIGLAAMSQTDRDAVYETWEGVLITVQNVAALGVPSNFGGTANPVDAFGVDITGDLVMDSNLAMFPTGIDSSTCFASVTGVEDYIASNWVIYPRSTAEIALGGTGCPTVTPTTVANIQGGTVTGAVRLAGVYVTARELTVAGAIGRRLWVADALQGASDNGVLVFFSGTIDPSIAVGAKVDVQGTVVEFDDTAGGNTLTELSGPTVTLDSAPGASLPQPVVVTAAQVGDITSGEPFEGVLVQIAHAKVTMQIAGGFNQVVLTDNAGGTVVMNDDAFGGYSGSATAMVPAVGTCFATITGVMDVQTDDDVRTIDPRSAADMVVGTGCN